MKFVNSFNPSVPEDFAYAFGEAKAEALGAGFKFGSL